MADNAQKKWFGDSQNAFARQKAMDAIQVLGKALPAAVVAVDQSIVTVKFEIERSDRFPWTLPNVTVPIQGCEYARPPTQVGDKGVVRPADVLLGSISGLGAQTVNFLPPSNLGALVWEPISSKNWSDSEDTNAYLIYGPNGFIFRDTGNNCSIVGNTSEITVTGKDKVTVVVGASKVEVTDGLVKITSDTQIVGNLTVSGDTSLGGGAKKVVLDGDPVVAGVVVASSTKTTAT
jgi:hypothetical protein